MTVGPAQRGASRRPVWRRSLATGAAAVASTTSHGQGSGSLLVIGRSELNSKHIPIVCLCSDTMVFTQHLRGMAACSGLWLGAMVVDRARLHTGIHTAALLTFWVRGRPGVYLAATILSHERAFTERGGHTLACSFSLCFWHFSGVWVFLPLFSFMTTNVSEPSCHWAWRWKTGHVKWAAAESSQYVFILCEG